MSEIRSSLGVSPLSSFRNALLFLSLAVSGAALYLQNRPEEVLIHTKEKERYSVKVRTEMDGLFRKKIYSLHDNLEDQANDNAKNSIHNEGSDKKIDSADPLACVMINLDDPNDDAPCPQSEPKIEELNPFVDFDLILRKVSLEMLQQELDRSTGSITDPEMAERIKNAYEEALEDLAEYLPLADDPQAICKLIGSEALQELAHLPIPGEESFGQMPIFKLLQQAIYLKVASFPGQVEC